MELVPYKSIFPQAKNTSIVENVYTIFGAKVQNLLDEASNKRNIFPCEYAANISTMRLLLGPDYTVSDVPIRRGSTPKNLKEKFPRRKRICILSTVSRYLIIQEK